MCSRIFLIYAILSVLLIAHATPTPELLNLEHDIATDSRQGIDEVDDMTIPTQTPQNVSKVADSPEDSSSEGNDSSDIFGHRDEDQLNTATNLVLAQNLKYDVEILESGNEKKHDTQVEEQFRGTGLEVNRDTFSSENIEMAPVDVDVEAIRESHMILSIALVAMAFAAIAIYFVLVLYRSHLEHRYGMRELLVTQDFDDVTDLNAQYNGNPYRQIVIQNHA